MSQRSIHSLLPQDKHYLRVPSTPNSHRHRPNSSTNISTDTLFRHETSARGLVDQFYTSSNVSEIDTSSSVLKTPSPINSRSQSFDRFEIKTKDIPDDKLKLNDLKEKVLNQLRTQLAIQDYDKDKAEFNEVLKGIHSLKRQLLEQLEDIESHYDGFEREYNQKFKTEIQRLFENLSQINDMEKRVKQQREKLDNYKQKLKGIRTKIEINEELKFKNLEMIKFRNKLVVSGILMISLLWIFYKIISK